MQQLMKDPVHKKIIQTKDAFVNDDDFDPEEAMEAAVNKRKFLIDRHLRDYNFTEAVMMKKIINYINICHIVLNKIMYT